MLRRLANSGHVQSNRWLVRLEAWRAYVAPAILRCRMLQSIVREKEDEKRKYHVAN